MSSRCSVTPTEQKATTMSIRKAPLDHLPKRFVGVPDAAKYIDVSERFIRRLVEQRRIRHYKVGQFVKFDTADLDAFVEAGKREAVSA